MVLPPPEGAVAGVDVRGGGPGTRETDLLDPRNLVDRVHAIVLTGGSALGLAAADGVVQRLFAAGVGLPHGRGRARWSRSCRPRCSSTSAAAGSSAAHPDAESARRRTTPPRPGPVARACVGAGTGAVAGGLKGGIGSASVRLAVGYDGRGAGRGERVRLGGRPGDR